ncbi:MAG: tetratricopeptide repeat protein [Deltaproteobacteria bacterium]|nr:tetratricopeptide repeat protein [Deltaproteobacteria bacterium]
MGGLVLMNGALWVIGLFTGVGLVAYHIATIPLALICVLAVEQIGEGVGILFSGWSTRKGGGREALRADIERAKHSKRNGRFEEALAIIDGVLEQDTEFPEALYLKAQFLWEGFSKPADARKCLQKVLQLTAKEETLHRWASSLYDEVLAAEKNARTIPWKKQGIPK